MYQVVGKALAVVVVGQVPDLDSQVGAWVAERANTMSFKLEG